MENSDTLSIPLSQINYPDLSLEHQYTSTVTYTAQIMASAISTAAITNYVDVVAVS